MQKAFFLLLILFLNIVFTTPSSFLGYECKNFSASSNQKFTISQPEVYCDFIITDSAEISIINTNLNITNLLSLNRASKLFLYNSTLNVKGLITLKDNSILSLNNSVLNIFSSIFNETKAKILGSSKFLSYKSNITSYYLTIESNDISYMLLNRTLFYGNISLLPLSYSTIISLYSSNFRLIIEENNRFNISISYSTFSIQLNINSQIPIEINLPSGYVNTWSIDELSSINFIGQLKVYNSNIGVGNNLNKITLFSKTHLKFLNMNNFILEIINPPNITNLKGKNIIISENLSFTFLNSDIAYFILNYNQKGFYEIKDSEKIVIILRNNIKLNINNSNIIDIISNNSQVSVYNSIIINRIFSYNNSLIYLFNSQVKDINNLLYDNISIIYFLSLQNIIINYFENNTKVNLDIYGYVLVLTNNTNLTMRSYTVSLGMKGMNKFITIIKGYTNKHGLLATYYIENIPKSEYIVKLSLVTFNDKILEVNKTIFINTNITVSPPSKPTLEVSNIKGLVELKWSVKEDLFIPIKGFKIYRGTSINNLQEIAIIEGDRNFYIDTTLEPNKEYYYAIKAYNEFGESELSNIVNIIVRSNVTKSPEKIFEWILGLSIAVFILLFFNYLVIYRKKKIKY